MLDHKRNLHRIPDPTSDRQRTRHRGTRRTRVGPLRRKLGFIVRPAADSACALAPHDLRWPMGSHSDRALETGRRQRHADSVPDYFPCDDHRTRPEQVTRQFAGYRSTVKLVRATVSFPGFDTPALSATCTLVRTVEFTIDGRNGSTVPQLCTLI